MSASEKLAALVSRRHEIVVQGSPEFKAFVLALPQIVAVVEAATEVAHPYAQAEVEQSIDVLRDCIAALDEELP